MITITNENDELKIVGNINLVYIEIMDTLEEVKN